MGNTCKCTNPSDLQLQSFHTRNTYLSQPQPPSPQTTKIILERIATGHPQEKYQKLAQYVAHCEKLEFVDHNFGQLEQRSEISEQEVQGFRRLYNFGKLRLQKVYEDRDTPLDIFDQREVQLCYLTTTFYLLCQTQSLKSQIFTTSFINPHSLYIVTLFCNGSFCDVIVDENLPTHKKNLKYLSINQMQEVWPFLLEKAWCKQIGGYDKAKGLSPEDCFEEVTGVPAFSLWFGARHGSGEIYEAITEALKKRHWIALTAKSTQTAGLKVRQVFYLEKYNETTQTYRIRSPYLQFEIPNRRIENKGQIQLSFGELLGYFQFATIGTYEPSFVPISYGFDSEKNQENIFQIVVTKPGKVNIRVIQFYAEYLSTAEKQFYKYSPVMLQLYNRDCFLIQKCEGLLENLEGVRSSKLSEQSFIDLQPGTYYLRVQVAWQSPQQLNSANVVIYAARNTIQIKKCQGDVISISGKLLSYTLEQPSIKTQNSQPQSIKIRYIEKNYGYIIGIENLSESHSKLKVIFQGSENIRINHHNLYGMELYIELEGRQERVFEVLPKDPRKRYTLNSFDIVKM